MNKLLFGKFISGNTFIYYLNPTLKLFLSFYFVALVCMANNWQCYLLLFLFIFLLSILNKISFLSILRGLKPLVLLITFTVMLQVFFSSKGTPFYVLGPIRISGVGLIEGLYLIMRFILIISFSTLLTITTPPLALANGIKNFLKPLGKIGFPVDTITLVFSIALRFIPTLMEEINNIIKAQKSRGISFNNGNIVKRVKNFVSLLVPVFVKSFNHAEGLANAMEARGYQIDKPRTSLHNYYWSKKDTSSIIISLALGLFILILRS